MNNSPVSNYAVAAIFPVALAPVSVGALRSMGAPDLMQGIVAAAGISATLLLLVLALRERAH